MKTIVYIDGYNLFYGRLKNTQYKWLDVFKLFNSICTNQDPSSEIIKIKYFTAPVKAKFATHGQAAQSAQETYHRALRSIYKDKIEIIKGYHTVEKNYPPVYKKPMDKNNRIYVWKLEEKQTDVNIALHMYRDAIRGKAVQQVLVSNDSDLEMALKLIRQDVAATILGVVIPRNKSVPGKTARSLNNYLSQYADWTRSHIMNDECEQSQLPDKIPTNKKPVVKPDYW